MNESIMSPQCLLLKRRFVTTASQGQRDAHRSVARIIAWPGSGTLIAA